MPTATVPVVMTEAQHQRAVGTPVANDGLVLNLAAAQQAGLADDHVAPDGGCRRQPRRRAPALRNERQNRKGKWRKQMTTWRPTVVAAGSPRCLGPQTLIAKFISHVSGFPPSNQSGSPDSGPQPDLLDHQHIDVECETAGGCRSAATVHCALAHVHVAIGGQVPKRQLFAP